MYSPHKHSLFAFKGYLLLYLILLIFGSHKKKMKKAKTARTQREIFALFVFFYFIQYNFKYSTLCLTITKFLFQPELSSFIICSILK